MRPRRAAVILVLAAVLSVGRVARADEADEPGVPAAGGTGVGLGPGPIRVAVECETYGRTKVCPAFLLGFVDAHAVLLSAPRSDADVILYASALGVAQVDKLHLRFVGNLAGAPKVIEVDVDLDTRATDDEQRAQIEPAFLRGVALFVAARHPGAVSVELAAPEAGAVAAPATTPWGVTLNLGGFGSWTGDYQSYNGYSSLALTRVTKKTRGMIGVAADGGLNRQPPLVIDGEEVDLDTQRWSVAGDLGAAWLKNDCWSFGGSARVWRDDPKGEYRYGMYAQAGVEWDRYPADDPRGNRLAVLYVAGYKVEGYNVRNILGERFAHYPIHTVVASGSIRKDKVSLGVSLSASGEILHPTRRHNLSASPYIEWQLGSHVDASVSFSITKRELPEPDPDAIDPEDYEQLSRLSYAEPLSMNGSFSITVHWDRTNGARNDRFTDI
jgi:hypothetical protein